MLKKYFLLRFILKKCEENNMTILPLCTAAGRRLRNTHVENLQTLDFSYKIPEIKKIKILIVFQILD